MNVQEKSDSNFLAETDFRNNVHDYPYDESDETVETDDTTEYQLKGGMKLVKRKKAKIRAVRFNKENDLQNYCREQLMLYTLWRNE